MRISSRVAVGSPAARLTAVLITTLLLVVLATGAVVAAASLLPSPEQVPAALPVEVTGTGAQGPCSDTATTETVGGVQRVRGGTCNPTGIWSDERLNGTVTWASNEDTYLDQSGLGLYMWAISIENADGAWRMRPMPGMGPLVGTEGTVVAILDGEGAYAGLTAILEGVGGTGTPHGFIIEGEFPPAPENASTK